MKNKMKNEKILNQVQSNDPELTMLELNSGDFSCEEIVSLVKALKNNEIIDSLFFYGSEMSENQNDFEISSEIIEEIILLIEKNSLITSWHFGEIGITDSHVEMLTQSLINNRNVSCLSFQASKITFLSAHSIAKILAIAKILPGNNSLTNLSLASSNIEDSGLEVIAKANESLTGLFLHSNGITDDGVKILSRELMKSDCLEHLDLRQENVQNAGAEAIAEYLRHSKSLKYLLLHDNDIGCLGIKAIASALEENNVLCSLGLFNNYLDEESTNAIAKMLKNNSTISSLTLSWRHVEIDMIKEFACMIKGNRMFKQLSLWWEEIEPEAEKLLCNALKENEMIEYLFICGEGET